MTKKFCDICEKELNKKEPTDTEILVSFRFRFKGHDVGVKILCGIISSKELTDICTECTKEVIDALVKAEWQTSKVPWG